MSYARHSIEKMREARSRLSAGESIRGVARSMDIPASTVARWAVAVDPAEPELSAAAAEGAAPQGKTGRSMVEDALRIKTTAESTSWAEFGRAHPLPGVASAAQSGRIFEAVASGLRMVEAFEAAGLRGGDVEVVESRARQNSRPFDRWFAALKICEGCVAMSCAVRVREGLAGWQGSRAMLAALHPAGWGADPKARDEEVNSIEGLDAAKLVALVEDQIIAYKGRGKRSSYDPSKKVVVPLHQTGVDDEK